MAELVVYGNPVLERVADPVEEITQDIIDLSEEMVKVMYAKKGVGLAAPQVGVSLRMFVYDLQDGEGPAVVINPILSEPLGRSMEFEGCLSVPGVSYIITRPEQIHLTGNDLHGNFIDLVATGLEARCLQHEVDHINGVLYLRRLNASQWGDFTGKTGIKPLNAI